MKIGVRGEGMVGGGKGFVGGLLFLLFASIFTWDGEERRIMDYLWNANRNWLLC